MAGSWGISLNNVYISGGSDASVNLGPACPEQINVGCLTSPPDGMGIPARRTEDVTFAQRDGVRHYSDWYEHRVITLEKVIVCDDGCGGFNSSCSARQKVRDLMSAWSRDCCDTEIVVYTPCNSVIYDSVPTASLTEERTNLFAYNSMGQTYTTNCGTFEFSNIRGFGSASGPYSNYIEDTDLPASVAGPMLVARKTWDTASVFYCRDYDEGSGDDRCYITSLCSSVSGVSGVSPVSGYYYDNEIPGSNDGAGFIMGCTGVNAFPVSEANTYTFSGYMRASISDVNMLVRVFFYDGAGELIASETGTIEPSVADTWVRVSHTAVVPSGAETMQFALDLADGGTLLGAGDTLDATAVLVENSFVLGDYFNGNFANIDDKELNGEKIVYSWESGEYQSNSIKRSYIYIPGRDRELNGPFGIVGRPRVAEVRWWGQGSSCAEVLLRFDAVDHRMYILDECGTPGSQECVSVEPGAKFLCRSYEGVGATRCYGEETQTWCYTNEVEGSRSVDPTIIDVLGTEPTYPIITLNGPLSNPRVQDTTANRSLRYRGNIAANADPIIVYTEDGTAYQGGVSVTHLFDGNLDFSFEPGTHELRLSNQSLGDIGTADICWRPAVVSA
jgi:hypothetical protein